MNGAPTRPEQPGKKEDRSPGNAEPEVVMKGEWSCKQALYKKKKAIRK
jgi:hypothetical protein